MAELTRGAVADRPWGRTLGALGLHGLTGQLTLGADGKRYQIAFSGGAVVGAHSPLASDAAVRVALTGGLLSSTQVADIARRQAAAPERDEIELIAELLRIGPDQAMRLRRRAVAQRAARTFSVDRGDFVVEDRITVPVVAGSELDIRSVIYLGARQNLSETRLTGDLAKMGAWFRLQPSALEDLPQFGFTEAERPVLERLKDGATLDQLDETGVEPRVARAMVYALISCNGCEIGGAGRAFEATGKRPSQPHRAVTDSVPPPRLRTLTPASSPAIPIPRRAAPSPPIGVATDHHRSDTIPRLARRHSNTAQAADVRTLIGQRLRLLDGGADHFQLLGVTPDSSPEDVRKAYFALARQLHPDRLAALEIDDTGRDAQRLFAQVNTAFAILSDKRRREEYTSVLRRGGEAAIRADQARAEAMARQILEGEEAFRRGEAALRRDQIALAITELSRAVELAPAEADYHATLAWAQFCAAPDKQLVAAQTRAALDRAIAAAPKAVSARFYLGRVERMLGRDADALRHFQDVLRASPGHHEAATEVRVLEQRLGGPKRR